jgi:hypothetical protein
MSKPSTALVVASSAAALLFAALLPRAEAGLDPAVKCESIKLRAVGKKAGADLKCHSKAQKKGLPVDAACLTKAAGKFQSSFTKAEKTVACAEPGDAATISPLVDAFVSDTVAALAPGGDGTCASKKLGAAGKKVAGLFKALSKDTKKPDFPKFQSSFAKAQVKFKKGFDKAEAKLSCATTDDAKQIRLDIDAFVELVIDYQPPACPQQLLYSTEGNRLWRIDIETIGTGSQLEDVLIASANDDPIDGRDSNGQICLDPDESGNFILGEDTGQPTVTPGWGYFDSSGTQIGKNSATYYRPQGEPHGCAFAADGTLFTSSIGEQDSGPGNGQLLMWFPPYTDFPGAPGTYPNGDSSTNFCKLAVNIGTAGSVAVDELGRVYVAQARIVPGVLRFSPPFPTGPDALGGCGAVDALGSPMADSVLRENFIIDTENLQTPTGIVGAPNGNWYVSSVFTGVIAEYDPDGNFVRRVLEPEASESGELPLASGHPQGLGVDCAGNLYYADLGLVFSGGGALTAGLATGVPGPGPNAIGPGSNLGTVRRITFDIANNPREPDIIKDTLNYPDGVTIVLGDLETP